MTILARTGCHGAWVDHMQHEIRCMVTFLTGMRGLSCTVFTMKPLWCTYSTRHKLHSLTAVPKVNSAFYHPLDGKISVAVLQTETASAVTHELVSIVTNSQRQWWQWRRHMVAGLLPCQQQAVWRGNQKAACQSCDTVEHHQPVLVCVAHCWSQHGASHHLLYSTLCPFSAVSGLTYSQTSAPVSVIHSSGIHAYKLRMCFYSWSLMKC